MPGHRWVTEFPGEEAFFLKFNEEWNNAMTGAKSGKRNSLKRKFLRDIYKAHREAFIGRMDNWNLKGWGRNNGTEEERKEKAYERIWNFYSNRANWGGNGQGEENNNIPTKTEMTVPGRRETLFNAYWRIHIENLSAPFEADFNAMKAAEIAKGNAPMLRAPFKNQWLSRRLKTESKAVQDEVEAGRLDGSRGKNGKFAGMAEFREDMTEDARLETAQKYQKNINRLVSTVLRTAQAIHKETGWAVAMLVGGPEPQAGGEITVFSAVKGELDGLGFEEYADGWDALNKEFMAFCQKITPREHRSQYSLKPQGNRESDKDEASEHQENPVWQPPSTPETPANCEQSAALLAAAAADNSSSPSPSPSPSPDPPTLPETARSDIVDDSPRVSEGTGSTEPPSGNTEDTGSIRSTKPPSSTPVEPVPLATPGVSEATSTIPTEPSPAPASSCQQASSSSPGSLPAGGASNTPASNAPTQAGGIQADRPRPPPSLRELRSQAKPDDLVPSEIAAVWTTDAGNYLEPRLGARGAELVVLFKQYEEIHGLPTKKSKPNTIDLGMAPPAIVQWARKKTRDFGNIPSKLSENHTAATMAWYSALQPGARGWLWPFKTAPDPSMDWAKLSKPSPNGIFLILMALSWFTVYSNDFELLTQLVDDFISVLGVLIQVATTSTSSGANTKKRKNETPAGGVAVKKKKVAT